MSLIILLLTLLVYLIWRFGTRNFDYWKRKGVKHEKPQFLFGNMYEQFMQRISLSQQITEWYHKFPEEPYVGVHVANDVALVLREPDLIKRVLTADFHYFHRRGINSHKTVRETLSNNLFGVDGDTWKLVRKSITPAFSIAKLKAMFPLIVRTVDNMLAITKPGVSDLKELMARYATDFIGTCGFGLELDSLRDDNSKFRCLGRRIFEITRRDTLAHMAKRIAPELFKHVHYFAAEIEDNTLSIVRQILEDRNYEPSKRNDFVDFLLEIKHKGAMVGESIEHHNPDGSPKIVRIELDETLIAAQIFTFFGAGFETSSSATSFLLHELAFHQDIQELCHDEIDRVVAKHNGKITYEAVKDMKYLEMALKEALRLHTSPGFLLRQSARPYTFPGSSLTIDEGVYILVPLQALHKDPRFFKHPESFVPDRFHPDNIDEAVRDMYMPFGKGPRGCIGELLGLYQSMAGVAAILSRYRVDPAPQSQRHPAMDPKSLFVDSPIGGLPLALVRRQR